MRLTEAGKVFVQLARIVLDDVQALTNQMALNGKHPLYRLQTDAPIEFTVLGDPAEQRSHRCPEVRWDSAEASRDRVQQRASFDAHESRQRLDQCTGSIIKPTSGEEILGVHAEA